MPQSAVSLAQPGEAGHAGGRNPALPHYPLRRTASEESVQRGEPVLAGGAVNTRLEILTSGNNNTRRKRPAGHRKGKAPNPPKEIVRSNSVNQVRPGFS